MMIHSTISPFEETKRRSYPLMFYQWHLQANPKVGWEPHLCLKQLLCIFYGYRKAGVIGHQLSSTKGHYLWALWTLYPIQNTMRSLMLPCDCDSCEIK